MATAETDKTRHRLASPRRESARLLLLRFVIVVTAILALNYIVWRWFFSLNLHNWWISIPLVMAETYSIIDLGLFTLTMWRSRRRGSPPPTPQGVTVDVFVTTYNEDVDLVMNTARHAKAIRYPHRTWILDDGNREELRVGAEQLGIDYITRGEEWANKPRHAKAGNINNALMNTSGEFILILDADMVPRPEILDRTLGYFDDDLMALVQTPQIFSNVPQGDPLGSQAPLFYGPIQEGKDGWNSAFFCGSNAVLRREALMQLGLFGYVTEVERSVAIRLRKAQSVIARAQRRAASEQVKELLRQTAESIKSSRLKMSNGEPLGEITYALQQDVQAHARAVVREDIAKLSADLQELGIHTDNLYDDPEQMAVLLGTDDLSPLNSFDAVRLALLAVDVTRPDEAQALLPIATISVTEDMATSMRLHSMGWNSAFHNELLADGLAPEDLSTMLTQRLRWAQGTMQVFFHENPLFLKGLSIPQRLMYFSTMWNYLSGFATLVYLTAPVLFLTLGIMPVKSFAGPFLWHFIPYFVANQLMFLVAAHGLPTWRGQQYTVALFPVWVKACTSAALNFFAGRPLNFSVTPKARQETVGLPLRRLKWQILAVAILVLSIIIGSIRLIVLGDEPIGTVVNLVWVAYDFLAFSVLIGAVRYRGYNDIEGEKDDDLHNRPVLEP